MTSTKTIVVSVHVGEDDVLSKARCDSIQVELDGIVGDRHRGFTREAWDSGDKQPAGVVRRNERHWTAVSVEELADITAQMKLQEPLTATCLGANLCLQGVPGLSKLPRGTLLKFSSGAVLMVEEYNPPCSDMGQTLAQTYTTVSGEAVDDTAFSQAAKFLRGVVGIVEVAGNIRPGDEVTVEPERLPKWLREP
ncbi:MAG: MOSC domain-containing protein [Halioglobus sp.]